MAKPVDEIYLSIAQDILSEIDEEWQRADIRFEYHGDAGKFNCTYLAKDQEQTHDFDISYQSFLDFEELYTITTKGGNNLWNRAKFTLFPDGEFSIDFEYDQTLADELEQLNKD